MEKQRNLQRLRCCVQNYDWGKKGGDSEVGRLYACNSGSEIDPEKPYAEFWMGTHDSGPAFLIDQDLNMNTGNGLSLRLKDWVCNNPNDVLGLKVVQKWGSDLPFLFKVLSVAKALSIQAHPDQELAKALHKLMPNYYKDDNHKPEMALAITHFQALCGFITIEEEDKSPPRLGIPSPPLPTPPFSPAAAHELLQSSFNHGVLLSAFSLIYLMMLLSALESHN